MSKESYEERCKRLLKAADGAMELHAHKYKAIERFRVCVEHLMEYPNEKMLDIIFKQFIRVINGLPENGKKKIGFNNEDR